MFLSRKKKERSLLETEDGLLSYGFKHQSHMLDIPPKIPQPDC